MKHNNFILNIIASLNMETNKKKVINDIVHTGQKYSGLFPDAALQKYENLLNAAHSISDQSQLQEVRAQLSAFSSELQANALASESTGDTWKKLTNRSKELFSAATLIKIVFAQVRQAISTTMDLDNVYTDLIKVNNELNRNNYAEYLSKCSQKAKELATTQQALIEGATQFSKSGYDLKTSDALAEKSTILANVGDMSESDSAKAIISGVQAYDTVDGYTESVDKAQALIDKFIKIGNTAGITTAEIAEGVHSVGSVFADTNTSVDEFIALLAAGNQQYQDADALALGLQNTALRIRSCTTELEAMGEEAGTVIASATELEEKIKSLTNIDGSGGVEILDAQEEFRSIYDILLDISKVYSQMSATDANALLELIAGKNHASAISAVLNNMSGAQEILQNSLGAAGTAQKEYDAYLQSTEAHIAQFQATLTETYSTFMNGDMISHTADIGTAVLNLVNHTDLLKHSILAVLALNVGKGITTVGGTIVSTTKQMHVLGNALQQVKDLPMDDASRQKSLIDIGNATKNLTEKNLKLLLSQKQLEDTDRTEILKKHSLTKEEALAKLEKMGLTTATNAQSAANVTETATTTTLKGALESLKASAAGMWTSFKTMIAANPIGFFLTVITTAISIATSAISKHNQKVEQAQEKAKEAANTANTLSTEISELTNKYICLSEAVKTDASAKDDLMSTQGELIKKLGLEGESVDSLIEKYGSLDNAIKQASLKQLGEAENDLIAGVDTSEQELLDVGKDNWLDTKNSIAATGKDAGKAWQVLDDAGIISSGSHTDKGGQWFLGGDDTTVEGILDNYQKLQDAMEALRESDAFTSEELSANPVWEKIYNRANEMKEAVETYNSSIQNLNANLAEQMMLKSLKGRDLPDTEEEFNTFRQELINTATSSNKFIGSEKDIEQTINDFLSTVPEFEGYYSIPLENELNKMNDLISHADTDLTSPITDSIEQITAQLEPQLSKLTEAYKNIFTDDGFTLENIDSSMLEELRKTFSDIEESIGMAFGTDQLETFFDVLTSGKSNAEQVQKAFDSLAASYMESTGILDDLSEANADAVKVQLEGLGVSNAQEIINASLMQSEDALTNAQEEVTRIKGESYASSMDLQNATTGELEALYNEANMCGLASGGLASLLAQKYNVNNLSIASAADCNALAEIYAWSETAAASLRNLAAAKQRAENGQYVPEEELKGKEKLANAEVEKAKATPNINTNPTVKTPAVNKGAGGGSPSKTTFSEVFDWLELRIKRLQSNFDKWINRAETAFTSNRIEKYYNKAVKQLENLMSANSKAYNRYLKKADDVKLSKEYKKKVQNGEISSETLKGKEGEKLAEQIKKYQEYWEKAQEYLDAYVEQAQKLANIPLDKAAAKIEKFNKTIELIDAKIGNVKVDNYKKANALIDTKETEQQKILKANQDAQKETQANLKKAKKTLSKDKYLNSDDGITGDEKKQIKKDLKEGKEVNLSYFKEGSAGYKAAVKYNEALKKNDKAKQETNLAKEAFNKWQQEAANQKFDNIRTYYNAKIAQLDAQNDLIQNEIDRIEAKGMAVTARYYQEQIDAENKKLEKYQEEKEQLEGQLQATEALGLKGTQVWYDMKEAIAELDAAIVQSDTDIAKLNKSITTLADESFKKMLSINQAKSEATDWAVGLMESKDNFDDENAAFTKEGIARLYSYVSSYQSSKENAADYQKLLDNLKSHYEQGTLSFTDVFGNLRTYNSMNEFKDSIDALYEGWREQISETNAYESKSIELIQEKLQKEISAMQELIDAKKAALSAEKNLHDYQKSIRTATDNIAALEKQIISIQGDTSEEGISRIQKLQKELADAQEDLSEKEYDKYISDQQSMLDNLQQEYSDLITSEMKQIEHLLENALSIMTNMETSLGAEGTIAQYLIKYGYKTNDTTAPSADTAGHAESGNQAGSATATSGNPAAFPAPSRAMDSSAGTVNFGSIPVPAAVSHEAASQNNRLTAVESVSFQSDDKKSLKEKALAYIRNRAGAPTKKKGEYSDVNKKIWDITDGKVLSTAKLKELAEIVGVAFDTAKSSGSLYKKLKAIGVQGFKHGGIGKLVKEQGEDGIAIVKNGEGFISPEDVDKIGSLVGSVPVLDNLSKNLLQLPSFDNTTAISNTSNTIEMQISLPGVQNYQEFATALQRDPRFEKFIKAISIDELSIQGNNNRLSKNKIHF